jgi:hypothetical protein
MPNPNGNPRTSKPPRAKRGTRPLTVGQVMDACDREQASLRERQRLAYARHLEEIHDMQARHEEELRAIELSLGARLEALIARVPEPERARARQVCGVPEPEEFPSPRGEVEAGDSPCPVHGDDDE